MSQIHYHKARSTLEELVAGLADSEEVAIVRASIETKIYLQVVFPKKTHFSKGDARSENVYQEFATEHEVIDVFRPGALTAGDRFWSWHQPAYRLKDVKRYHEEGLSRSPMIIVREPVHPIQGDRFIAVINRLPDKENADFRLVYSIRAREGLGAEAKLRQLCKRRPRRSPR
jgi:hypothetical protein